MRLANVNFETWCRNHDDDHEAKWCRELYPWSVFASLRYGDSQVGVVQEIEARGIVYQATISEVSEGKNGRLNHLISLKTSAQSKTAAWRTRGWDDLFHLVATQDGQFITLFTEKRDPSKSLLGSFLGSDFPRIEESRSRPLSSLLFRSLVSYRAEEVFGPPTGDMSFEWIPNGVRSLRPHKQFRPQPRTLEMLWADGRKRWVTSAWTEEKAHRYALYNASQCEELYVVYSHRTFTKHHRCEYPKTHVLSLLAFVQSSNNSKKSKFLSHARLLINHLRRDDIRKQSKQKPDELARAIRATTGTVEIHTSYLREAGAGLEVEVTEKGDAAYFFACANLLNAALTGRYGRSVAVKNLSKEVYSFKARVGHVVEELVATPIDGVDIYVERGGPIYVKVGEIQFSFHAIPRTPTVEAFARSKRNRKQEWSGVRLQPIAPLILDWGRAMFVQK